MTSRHQSWTATLHGRKFFDFGFGNATGYYDIIERPVPDHPRNGSSSDGEVYLGFRLDFRLSTFDF